VLTVIRFTGEPLPGYIGTVRTSKPWRDVLNSEMPVGQAPLQSPHVSRKDSSRRKKRRHLPTTRTSVWTVVCIKHSQTPRSGLGDEQGETL
jgi:hypothetical protein